VIYAPEEAFEDRHFAARGFPTPVEHPEIGRTVRYPGAPYRFEKTPWRISRRAPRLGEHQAEVFADWEACTMSGYKIIDVDSTSPSRTISGAGARPRSTRASASGREERREADWVVDDGIELAVAMPVFRDPQGRPEVARRRVDGLADRGRPRRVWDMKARVELLDALGLYAQILYPNIAGFGSQNFMKVKDDDLRLACAQVYNDAMAEIQAESAGACCRWR
jgi:hypothetical protein